MEYYSSYKQSFTPRNADPEILSRITKLKDGHDISPNVFSFLSSLIAGYKKYGGITKKQYEAFCDIESDYLCKKATDNLDWHERYDASKKELMHICALYYCANPPYYGDLAHRVLYDKNFVPSERQYKRLTQNKYAQKVLHSHFSESKFKVNDYVSFRKNNPYKIDNKENIFIIIQIAPEPVTTAAKGTKKYKILSINNVDLHVVEERWLKNTPKNKIT
jgi:hypothetical protein